MARFVILYFVVLLSCYLAAGILGSPVTRAETNTSSKQEIVGLSTPTEQHYLHSMISELLTKVVIDPFKEIVTMTALYLEIFSVASGSHIIAFSNPTPLNGEDREIQLIAIAGSNIWSKLPYAEELNAIFLNSSKSIIPNILNKSSSENVAAIVKELFKRVEKTILSNESLAPMYREEKIKAEKLTVPQLAPGTGNPDTVYENYPRFRNFIIRRQLLEHLYDHDAKVNNTVQFQRHALSQAVVQMAKTAKGSKMQEIFDQAVEVTMDKIDPSSKKEDPSVVIDEILFTSIEEKFKMTPELNDEFVLIKNDLIKKHAM